MENDTRPYICQPGQVGQVHELSYHHSQSTGYDRAIGEMVERGTCRCGLPVARFVFEGQRPIASRIRFFPADRLASVVAGMAPEPFGPDAPPPVGPVDYSPDQREQVLGLWRQLLDCHTVRVHAPSEYGHGAWPIDIDDERLAELVDSDGEPADEYRVPVIVVLASFSDYGGASYDAANVRTLAEYPGVSTSGGHHGESSAEVTLGALPGDDSDDVPTRIEWLVALVELIQGVCDYPIIDEDVWSTYEMELQDEAWDSWLYSDVMHDLSSMIEAAAGDDFDYETAPDPTDQAEAVREAYYSFEDNEWVCESATSATNMRHDDALRHVASTVFGLTAYWVVEARAAGHVFEVVEEFTDERAARNAMYRAITAEREHGASAREFRTRITARA